MRVSKAIQVLAIVVGIARFAKAIPSINLTAPSSPTSGQQVIGPDFQSFSLETFSWFDYTGNKTYTNKLNTNLVGNIRNIGGKPLHVRIGGSSGNSISWNASLEVGMVNYFPPGSDKATSVTLGPQFFDGFDAWPSDTYYALGLPFSFTNFSKLNDDMTLAKTAYDKLGSRLEEIEIGNEFNSKSWKPVDYVNLWLPYARNISKAVYGVSNQRAFMVGDLQEAWYINETCIEVETTACWTVESLLKLGIRDSGLGRATSVHIYLTDSGNSAANMDYMLNHTNTVIEVKKNTGFISEYVKDVGLQYYIGETNSFSGHGLSGVSDRFGAALWSINYVLYSATSDINRLYFHQGTGWKYSAWLPVSVNSLGSGVRGAYYSWLFTATALSGGGKQVEVISQSEFFTAYAIYNSGKLESIVAINLEAYYQGDTRSKIALKLPSHFADATVKRLTAPAVDVYWGVTFAGQGVDSSGKINGTLSNEDVKGLTVGLGASEAVLITI